MIFQLHTLRLGALLAFLIGLVTVLLSVLAVQWAVHRANTTPPSLASPPSSKP